MAHRYMYVFHFLCAFTVFDVVEFLNLEDYFNFVIILQLYKNSNVLNKIYYNYNYLQ